MGTPKTNAMRILEKEKISYQMHTYDASDGQIDGAAVARKVGMRSPDTSAADVLPSG